MRDLVAVVLALILGSGCSSDATGDDGPLCTLEGRASVQVTVTDEQGPATDTTVVFSVNGGAETDCETITESDFVCGWEREGNFVITARKTGYADATQSVKVGRTEDGCHVEGKRVELELTRL
jgi:hypothetical protein